MPSRVFHIALERVTLPLQEPAQKGMGHRRNPDREAHRLGDAGSSKPTAEDVRGLPGPPAPQVHQAPPQGHPGSPPQACVPRRDAEHGPRAPAPPRLPQDHGKWSNVQTPSPSKPAPHRHGQGAGSRRQQTNGGSSHPDAATGPRNDAGWSRSYPCSRVNHISIPGGIPQRQNDSPVSQRTLRWIRSVISWAFFGSMSGNRCTRSAEDIRSPMLSPP